MPGKWQMLSSETSIYTLSENHDKRIKTLHGVTLYPYGYGCYAAFLESAKIKKEHND